MSKVVLKIDHLRKSFGKKEVIKDFDLEVYEGEFLTLLGSSGCGKTTILRAIAGLDSVTEGHIYIDGKDVTSLDSKFREVNTIFQNYALFPLMTVEENIAFGLKMKKVDKEEIQKRVQEMLTLVHLEGYEKRKPRELSGGEQQRVSIARALINNPKVLLLDEPLSALDQKLRTKMQLELKALQRKLGITFVYVTHSQDEALTMSDRIVLLKDGKIEQADTPIKIYEHPKSLYTAQFLGDSNLFQGIVTKVEVKYALVTLEDATFKVFSNHLKENMAVDVVIRPENIKLSIKKKSDSVFEGEIIDAIYDGASTKLIVRVGRRTIHSMFLGNDKEYVKGQKVYVTWDIEDVILFERDIDEK